MRFVDPLSFQLIIIIIIIIIFIIIINKFYKVDWLVKSSWPFPTTSSFLGFQLSQKTMRLIEINEMKLPYEPICLSFGRLVCRSVCHNF